MLGFQIFLGVSFPPLLNKFLNMLELFLLVDSPYPTNVLVNGGSYNMQKNLKNFYFLNEI
jgi:hypothetical protein